MKICWWTYYPTVNHTALLTALRARGIDVEVCYFQSYDTYRTQMTGWREPELAAWEHACSSWAEARRVVPDFEARIQMVPGYSKVLFWQIIAHCVWTKRPWFAMCEGTRGRWVMRPLVKAFSFCVNRWAMRLFALSTQALAQYRQAGVCNGVRFGYAMSSDWFTPRADEPTGPCRFVFAGALIDRKAVDVLASAWRLVQAEVPGIELRVIGEGPLRSCFDGLAGVTLLGACPPEAMRAAIAWGDVMVLPSRYDAWGVALVEGAAQGLALIASESTGARELIVPRGADGAPTGLCVKTADVASLAAALRVYATDPARARAEGRAAAVAAAWFKADSLADLMIRELRACQMKN